MKIVYCSPIMWDDLKQRPQHLAEELSRNNEVIFLEPTISVFKGWSKKLFKPRDIMLTSSLRILRFNGVLKIPMRVNLGFLEHLFNCSEIKKFNSIVNEETVIILGTPSYNRLLSDHTKGLIIYDKMDAFDELTLNNRMKSRILNDEKFVLEYSKLVLASSGSIYKELIDNGRLAALVPNGVPLDFWHKEEKIHPWLHDLKNDYSRVFGYIGTVDHWFDYHSISTILNYSEKFVVVLIGNIINKDYIHPRLFMKGTVDKKDIPMVLNGFDFCLYPFKDHFIDSINPVKIYEYISCNKIVISKSSKEIQLFSKLLYQYSTLEEMKALLGNIDYLCKPFSSEDDRYNFIEENSWQQRAEDIVKLVLLQDM